ncbi:MAG: Uncharacterised protein [SAR116 cluster bacterium]|nr:MAG: Uncharacterised protein [SAR116 cluster bacterium]
MPAIGGSVFLAGGKRCLVIARDPDNIGPECRHRRFARRADMFVDIDFRGAAGALCPPRYRPPMIAVGRCCHHQVCGAASLCGGLFDKPAHRIGSAKRLEGPQPETGGFILEDDAAHPQMRGDIRQVMQGCRHIAVPAGDLGKGIGHGGGIQRSGAIGKASWLMRRVGAAGKAAGLRRLCEIMIHDMPPFQLYQNLPIRSEPV